MEVWAISLLSVVNLLAIAVVLQIRGIAGALPILGVSEEIPESPAGSVAAAIASAANFSAANGALTVLERVGAMVVHVSLTVVVAYGVMKGQRKYLPLPILAHAGVDLIAAPYQRGVMSLPVTEVLVLVCAALLAVWAGRLYRELGEPN